MRHKDRRHRDHTTQPGAMQRSADECSAMCRARGVSGRSECQRRGCHNAACSLKLWKPPLAASGLAPSLRSAGAFLATSVLKPATLPSIFPRSRQLPACLDSHPQTACIPSSQSSNSRLHSATEQRLYLARRRQTDPFRPRIQRFATCARLRFRFVMIPIVL